LKSKPDWTDLESATLQELRKRGVPAVDIAEQLNRTVDAVRCKLYQLRLSSEIAKYTVSQNWLEGARIGFLDLETSSFDADAGIILSYSLKLLNGELFTGVITRKEILSGRDDYRLVKELVSLIRDNVDIVATYYGTGFDIPFLRSRAIVQNIPFFQQKEKYHLDIYYWVKYLLKLHRNSLDSATAFLSIEGKNHVDLKIWNRARVGDKEALEYVLNHNIEDVKILEELFVKLQGYKPITRRSL